MHISYDLNGKTYILDITINILLCTQTYNDNIYNEVLYVSFKTSWHTFNNQQKRLENNFLLLCSDVCSLLEKWNVIEINKNDSLKIQFFNRTFI